MKHLIATYLLDAITVLEALTYVGNLDNFALELREESPLRFCHGNVRNSASVGELVAQVDVVVHWAAETHVPRSIYDATTFFETGVLGTQVIVNAISEHPVERFPHLSSLGIYGAVEIAPMTEEHPLNLSISSASAKTHAGRFVYSYCAAFALLYIIVLRPFNTYDPNQRPEKVIPRFVTGALMDEPLPVQGDETHSRHWPYVQDPCRNLDRALHANLQQVGSLAINLGIGVDRTIEHVAELVGDKLGTPEISSL